MPNNNENAFDKDEAACIITMGTGKTMKLVSVFGNVNMARESACLNGPNFKDEVIQIWQLVSNEDN